MESNTFTTSDSLHAQVEFMQDAPKQAGTVKMICARPAVNERKRLDQAELDTDKGLIGDSWFARGNEVKKGEVANKDMQLNLMNARVIAAIANDEDRWTLAGDQLFVDLDLSYDNLPVGTKLMVGSAMIEVTAEPHLGCLKFRERFGRDALVFVNSALGKSFNARGINATIIKSGIVKTGDAIKVV